MGWYFPDLLQMVTFRLEEDDEMKPSPKLILAITLYIGPLAMAVWFIISHYI